MSPLRKILAIVFLFAAFSGGAVLLFHAVSGTPSVPQRATVIPAAFDLPEFSLVDHTGNPFTTENFRDSWSVVFFGFTHCPDICPATLQQLALAKSRVEDAGGRFPRNVLISVDPERDSPAVMGAYVRHFGEDVIGVTGDLDALKALTKPLGIYFEKSGDLEGDYSVDHSAVVLLIDDSAKWHALFSAPYSVDDFVHDIPLLTGG